MMWGDGYGMSGAAVAWCVLAIVMAVLIIVGVLLLVRGYAGRKDGGGTATTSTSATLDRGGRGVSTAGGPLGILEERYARGEIEREEFLRRKTDLQS